MIFRALLAAYIGACCIGFSSAAHAELLALQRLSNTGARITAEVVDLESGEVLDGLNAQTRLAPASISKILVAAKALNIWPADKIFETRVLSQTPPRNGEIIGDLYLTSNGDATITQQTLWALAAQVRASGVRSISGSLLVNVAPFGVLGCETKDRCDALSTSATAYNAPIGAIGSDFGNWCIDVHPIKAGSPAVINGCGGIPLPISIDGTIKTVGAKQRSNFWLDRITVNGRDVLRAGGSLAQGASVSEYRAMSNPPMGVGLLLKQTLAVVGVAVEGDVRIQNGGISASSIELARVEGLSLKEQLGRMLRFSNNYIADVITLNIAAADGRTPASLAESSQSLSQYVAAATGKDFDPPQLFSGSGLTPESRIAAHEMTAVLATEFRNQATFPVFYGSLVVPRQGPFAFLRTGSADWKDRLSAKTGSMNEPVSVCALSGYIRKRNGHLLAFAVIVNGGPTRKHVPLGESMEAIRSDLGEFLARY